MISLAYRKFDCELRYSPKSEIIGFVKPRASCEIQNNFVHMNVLYDDNRAHGLYAQPYCVMCMRISWGAYKFYGFLIASI